MELVRNTKLPFRNEETNLDTTIVKICAFSVAVDPASITNATSAETLITVNGVNPGDFIQANVPPSLETGLAFTGVRVSAANQIALRLTCVAAAPVDGASRTWSFLWYDLTP